jgi:hypothetical protein
MNVIDVSNTLPMNSRALLQNFEDTGTPVLNDVTTLFSIIDYAQEPLLSLIEVCAPLIPFVDNILNYALIAMERTPSQPANGLTRDESASIRLYTMEFRSRSKSVYFMLNKVLNAKDRTKL